MKKIFKSMLTALLCAVIFITGIQAGAGIVYAARKAPLRITFNGKSINLIDDLPAAKGRGDSPMIKTVEKKWGTPKIKKGDGWTSYIWKKGKTTIEVGNYDAEKEVGSIAVNIQDKYGAMFGVKVGMKKDKALKKVQKMFGKKNVVLQKEGQDVTSDDDGNWIVEGEPTGDGEFIMIYVGYMPFGFGIEDGKVTSMSFWRS